MEALKTIVANANEIIKDGISINAYIQRTGKCIDILSYFAICTTITTPFLFVAKMYIVTTICCLTIITMIVIIGFIQKKWDRSIESLKEKVNVF